ncbi:MAG: argininosuccinate synthase [Nitrospinota bacterium]|jgi:argininosuccinate synthase|nr:argininosuccinate synthase [Nitrospinota bacterium]MDP7555216.1 argininosuccinate synthase [Nitrospinota bacterium]MDP7580075.1 argininosuccinate synthase [Nitrospinota bacterium]HJN02104.1 argininosuccinate synthase [Nitrospinota bacterium]
MNNKKVVLAYSGGLDTSIIVHWLAKQGYKVIGLLINLGQRVEDLDSIREKGINAGAEKVLLEDAREEFVSDYVFPAIQANAVYEGTYLLGTSIARPLIAKKQIKIAESEGAQYVSHGATGKGNDQVRFELSYYALNPDIKVIAPWRDEKFLVEFPGRQEMIAYAKKNNIPVKATKNKPWSSDENLMHISFEAGMLEDPWEKPLEEMFEYSVSPQKAPDKASEILIDFENGIPISVNSEKMSPAKLLAYLNKLGGENGIGRVDMVESRFVGMKSRGVYETPGGTILHATHRAIESITIDRDVMNLKDSLMPRIAGLIYNGFWFSPEMKLLKNMISESQKGVTGEVRIELYKGNCTVTGKKAPKSLYNKDIASMDKGFEKYNPKDAEGFININALPLKSQKVKTD